jgi:hypothetical protein
MSPKTFRLELRARLVGHGFPAAPEDFFDRVTTQHPVALEL